MNTAIHPLTDRTPWNKDRVVGQMQPLGVEEVWLIRQALRKRGAAGYRDLALFNLAIDSMTSAPDFLALRVIDVRNRLKRIRDTITIARLDPRLDRSLLRQCVLSRETERALRAWLESSGLKDGDLLFPGRAAPGQTKPGPLTARQASRLMKEWTQAAGLDPVRFGLESLRRTRAAHIFAKTGDIETVRILLGHSKIESTVRFLNIVRMPADALALARLHEI